MMYHETEIACPLCSVAGCNCVDNPDNIIDQDIDVSTPEQHTDPRVQNWICEQHKVIDTSEFMRGQRDCRDGHDHKAGQSYSYDRGFATQYEWEQIQSNWTQA